MTASTDTPVTDAPAPAAQRRRPSGPRGHSGGKPNKPSLEANAPRSHPLLATLSTLYPALFGDSLLPLKRGIFQDLQAAHPELLETDALKAALALHTRSSRYLSAVASGLQRHDLQGQAVEPMAPEHVYQALVEVFRRRQTRSREDLTPKVIQRMVQAFEASGLSRESYAERMRGRDEGINAVLDLALAEAAARSAKDEAQLRAFEASGQTIEAFADMYGLDPVLAAQCVERARAARSRQSE